MALRVWDPIRDTVSLSDVMPTLFENAWVRPGSVFGGSVPMMPLDVEESGDGYTVKASLPGFRPEDVDVTVTGDTLTITAQHKEEQENKDRNYLLKERRFGKVTRTITLPSSLQTDSVQARYENGELILTLPKDEALRPRQIPITSGQQNTLTGGQSSAQVIDHQPAELAHA